MALNSWSIYSLLFLSSVTTIGCFFTGFCKFFNSVIFLPSYIYKVFFSVGNAEETEDVFHMEHDLDTIDDVSKFGFDEQEEITELPNEEIANEKIEPCPLRETKAAFVAR